MDPDFVDVQAVAMVDCYCLAFLQFLFHPDLLRFVEVVVRFAPVVVTDCV